MARSTAARTRPHEGGDATFNITRGFDTNGGCKGPTDGLLFNFDAGPKETSCSSTSSPSRSMGTPTVAQFLEVITWEFDGPPDVPAGDDQHRTLSYDDHVATRQAGHALVPDRPAR